MKIQTIDVSLDLTCHSILTGYLVLSEVNTKYVEIRGIGKLDLTFDAMS